MRKKLCLQGSGKSSTRQSQLVSQCKFRIDENDKSDGDENDDDNKTMMVVAMMKSMIIVMLLKRMNMEMMVMMRMM